MNSDVTEWGTSTLYELATYINGRVTKASERVAEGIPVIRIAELNRGIGPSTVRVPISEVQEKHQVKEGDLLFAWSGSVGIHVYKGQIGALNQHIFRVIAKDGVDQDFLRYLLEAQLPLFNRLVESKRTTMGHVTIADLRASTVQLPPMDVQKNIASVLGAIDEKVDSNLRLADLLELLVLVVFGARFVDFLGPDGLREVDDRGIPNGWRRACLTDIAEFVNGKAFTKHANGKGRPILRIKELKAGITNATLWSDIDSDDRHIGTQDDVLFAWSGSLGVYRWSGQEALINQHVFKVIPIDCPPWFVFGWVLQHMPEFQAIARDKATTMGHIQRRHLAEAVVAMPDDQALASVSEILEPLDQQRAALLRESRTLTAIRTALLPKLISGEIPAPSRADLDEAVGVATERAGG